MGVKNEVDTHSIDGAWTAINVSKTKLYQQGPGSKRKRDNDRNRLKSGVPTTKHRIYQRTQRIGDREKQYAKTLSETRRFQVDDPEEWLADAKMGSNQVKGGTNHAFQDAEDPTATEQQFIPTPGLETANSPLKYKIRNIKFTHCIGYYKYCKQTGEKIYKRKKEIKAVSCTIIYGIPITSFSNKVFIIYY